MSSYVSAGIDDQSPSIKADFYVSHIHSVNLSSSSFSSPSSLLQTSVSILLLFIRIKKSFLGSKPLFFAISFQMAVSQRFQEVNDETCNIVHFTSLKVDHKYPIVKAERVQTGYGETVLLSISYHLSLSVLDLTPLLVKVFLPKLYARVFKDEDISSINGGSSVLDLVYKDPARKQIYQYYLSNENITLSVHFRDFLFFTLSDVYHPTDGPGCRPNSN